MKLPPSSREEIISTFAFAFNPEREKFQGSEREQNFRERSTKDVSGCGFAPSYDNCCKILGKGQRRKSLDVGALRHMTIVALHWFAA